jgi:hypothetical protein
MPSVPDDSQVTGDVSVGHALDGSHIPETVERPKKFRGMVYSRGVAEKNTGTGVDVLQMIGPEGPNGMRVSIRHTKDHQIELGVLTPQKDGRPLSPKERLLQLTPQGADLYKVENEFSLSATYSGPAQVNSAAFRDGWDRIFGPKTIGSA